VRRVIALALVLGGLAASAASAQPSATTTVPLVRGLAFREGDQEEIVR